MNGDRLQSLAADLLRYVPGRTILTGDQADLVSIAVPRKVLQQLELLASGADPAELDELMMIVYEPSRKKQEKRPC